MKRICVLTGASGLLGTEFLRRYAQKYRIIAVYNHNQPQFSTQDQVMFNPLAPDAILTENLHPLYAVRANLQKQDDIDRLITKVKQHFGGVDLLINCAAVRNFSNLLLPRAVRNADKVFAINVVAPLRLSVGVAKAFWTQHPEANRKNKRNVINISSTAGLFIYPNLGQGLYCASKAALNALTGHLASEFNSLGIRVNAVAPDTFPGRVSMDAVLESIIRLDESDETGQIVQFPAVRANQPQ